MTRQCRAMFDLWASEHSVLREKVLEHAFLTELSKALLLDIRTPFEVLRSEFDGFGYDVVIEAKGILRHVQLKATRVGGKRAYVDVGLSLTNKPGGCVIWFMVDERNLAIGPFYWLGGRPGEKMPALGDRVTRHTRGKGERAALRQVTKGKFKRLESIRDLAMAMFGTEGSEHDALLRTHLAKRGLKMSELGVPATLAWSRSIEFAHLIDGYELVRAAGLGDPIEYQAGARGKAEQTGEWAGTVLELWASLFLEHRREHLGGAIGIVLPPEDDQILDQLCRALVVRLAEAKLG
jgi:hypothetical protein